MAHTWFGRRGRVKMAGRLFRRPVGARTRNFMKTLLVTGGAGFIGSNFVLGLLGEGGWRIVNLDKLTYAGNLDTLAGVKNDPNHVFVHGDIGDRALVAKLLNEHKPT